MFVHEVLKYHMLINILVSVRKEEKKLTSCFVRVFVSICCFCFITHCMLTNNRITELLEHMFIYSVPHLVGWYLCNKFWGMENMHDGYNDVFQVVTYKQKKMNNELLNIKICQ